MIFLVKLFYPNMVSKDAFNEFTYLAANLAQAFHFDLRLSETTLDWMFIQVLQRIWIHILHLLIHLNPITKKIEFF